MASEGTGSAGCLNETTTVSVATPDELVEAVLDKVCHIVITAHLDLTTLDLVQSNICPDGCESALPYVRHTASIRVRNTPSPPPAPHTAARVRMLAVAVGAVFGRVRRG